MTAWNEIDFLPQRYREQHVQRKNFLWRVVVLGAYLGLLAMGSVAQRARLHRLQGELVQAQQQLAEAQQLSVQLEYTEQQLSRDRAAAQLVTYLQHPWPRTQILAAILPRVPESIYLTELRLYPLAQQSSTPFWQRQSTDKKDKDKPAPPPALADLQRLREERATTVTVVQLNGVAQDQAVLHAFLQHLAEDELFAAVELLSIESLRSDANIQGCAFEVCLKLRPGHGEKQPAASSTAGSIQPDVLAATAPDRGPGGVR